MVERKHEGVYLLGQFGPVASGAWLFVSGRECALFEAPEYGAGEVSPAEVAESVIVENDLHLAYVLISHPHRDHVGALEEYRQRFPGAAFIAHKTASYILNGSCSGRLLTEPHVWQELPSSDGLFDHLYEDEVVLPFGSERIHQVYAPKHSPGDTITWFHQVLFSGDWWLFEGDPGNCREVQESADTSISRVLTHLDRYRLEARHVFPSHANNMLYDVDVREVLRRSFRQPGVADAPWCEERTAEG